MTNNTINVPRELLERARAAVASTNTSNWSSDLLRDIHAILSAPSPAGVDGLDTDRNAAFKACPESGCDWGSFYLGWKARGEVEQAIIDGLRGEVADLLSMLATVSKAGIRVRTERDQQAQRIGELEGLLRDFAYHTQRREMPTESSLAEWADRIDAALSAGKEDDD